VTSASVPFDDYVNSKNGSACQISIVTTRNVVSNFSVLMTAAENTLKSQGWSQDPRYGAAGVGGYQIGYAKGKDLCYVMAFTKPVDPSLCPSNSGQPITVCWDSLPPEQMQVGVTLTCAHANFP
jgi:hypothetical protein